LCEVGVNTPVAFFVGIGQCAAGDLGAYAHVVELVALGFEAGFDVAQALSIGELRECHGTILVLASKALDVSVAIVSLSATPKGVQRQMIHHLCKNEFACIHRLTSPNWNTRLKRGASRIDSSSR